MISSENYNEHIAVQKKKKEKKKKYAANMEIRRKQYESEKANKVNNDLKLNVDEQQDDIKHLKELLKEKALCVTCNPSISTRKSWLKRRIHETITKKSSCETIVAKC